MSSSSSSVAGLEGVPAGVDLTTIYPSTRTAFYRRLLTIFIRMPLLCTMASLGLQALVCHRHVNTLNLSVNAAVVASGLSNTPNGTSTASISSSSLYEITAQQVLLPMVSLVSDGLKKMPLLPPSFISAVSPSSDDSISPEAALFFSLFVTANVMYILMNGFFLACDTFGWLARYKVPREKKVVPSTALIHAAIVDHFTAATLVRPIASWAFAQYLARNVEPVCGATEGSLDPIQTYIYFAVALMLNETGFYWVHRICHEIPALYRAVHKQHHLYIGTVSVAAEYAHPLEDAFANSLPLIAVALVMPVTNPLVFGVWVAIRLWETYEAHSGYCFQSTWLSRRLGLLNASHQAFHDFHHVVNKGNYGMSVFWDYIMGTDAVFVDKLQKTAAAAATQQTIKTQPKIKKIE